MTDQDLNHLLELRAKATPGPWRTRRVETPGDGPDSFAELIDTEARAVMRHPAHGARGANWAPEEADAALIVEAVNAIEPLVRELKEARAAITQARRGAFEEGRCAGISETAGMYHLSHKPCDGFTKCPHPECVSAFERYRQILAAKSIPSVPTTAEPGTLAADLKARRGAFEEAAAAVRGANGISEDQNWHYEMAARHIEALAAKSCPSVPTTAEPAAVGGANEVVACGVGTCRKPRSPNQEACSDCRACLYLIKVENLAADLKATREEVARLRAAGSALIAALVQLPRLEHDDCSETLDRESVMKLIVRARAAISAHSDAARKEPTR